MKKFSMVVFLNILTFILMPILVSAEQRAIQISAKTLSSKTIPLYDNSYALVIGNGDYTNGWENPLPGAIRDSVSVVTGQNVKKGDVIALTGKTGLAGGDHLDFRIMVNGLFVTPLEWWDNHWIQENILRKLFDQKYSNS